MELVTQSINCSSRQIKLTIAIPTYNRPKSVCRLIEKLIPQLTNEIDLLIVDNGTSPRIDSQVKNVLNKIEACEYWYFRNSINIGGCANILRCFELSKAPWIWVIGDEEIPSSKAVEQILSDIRKYDDVIHIKYASDLSGHDSSSSTIALANGTLELFERVDSFSNLLFLSSGVYRRDRLERYVPKAYAFGHTFAPHLALLLFFLRSEAGRSLVSSFPLVTCGTGTEGGHWDSSHVSFRLHELLEILVSSSERRQLGGMMGLKGIQSIVRWKTLFLLILVGEREKLRRLLADELRQLWTQNLYSGKIRIAMVVSLFLKRFASECCGPLHWLVRRLGVLRKHAGVPQEDLVTKLLADKRI